MKTMGIATDNGYGRLAGMLPVSSGSKPELTGKRRLFVQEYLNDLNATQAAIRAGYSRITAKQQAARLLTNVDIQTAFQAAIAKRASKLELTAESVLKALQSIAYVDPGDFFDESGNLKPPHEWPAQQATAVESFKMVKRIPKNSKWAAEYSIRIKFWDKPKALELLMKHLGMLSGKPQRTSEAPPLIHVEFSNESGDTAPALSASAPRSSSAWSAGPPESAPSPAPPS